MQLHRQQLGPLIKIFLFYITLTRYLAQPQEAGSPDYYANSCPNAESVVRNTLRGSFIRDNTSPAALIRLLFHDCQVNGCDASIMLDSGSDGSAEVEAAANLGIRRQDFIVAIKKQLELACPQTVSCADIIALAAREAIIHAGGPAISIPLGRLDGFDASRDAAESALPPATISVPDMLDLFSNMGMSTEESVAILGSHTMGVAHCTNFADRLYPTSDPNLNRQDVIKLKARCPRLLPRLNGPQFPINAFAALDTSNFRFDNTYFRNLVAGRALLTIDSNLAMDPTTGPIVENFAQNQGAFFDAFSSAFVKLSSFQVLTGSQGEVRLRCDQINQ
ncbi:hypothetical protein GOP47_0003159 [Adiantum capillus-veneris]|uniref:Peroxidase n=1 Tax=Adiantum capillus-veneris TaxID=13818 RepID=A0A9D4VBG1_ADICA|nr:hypothetical protein GOP47_0003159 [Adiantum capillus-veneris]